MDNIFSLLNSVEYDLLFNFRVCVEEKNLIRASKKLKTDLFSILAKLYKLESVLEIQIFASNPNRLIIKLTDVGIYVRELIFLLLNNLNNKKNTHRLCNNKNIIRIATTESTIKYILNKHIVSFLKERKGIQIQIDTQSGSRLIEKDEIFFRPTILEQEEIIKVKIHTARMGLYVSKSWIKQNGLASNSDELSRHNFLAYDDLKEQVDAVTWIDENGCETLPQVVSNSFNGTVGLCESGLGILVGTDFSVSDTNLLECLSSAPPSYLDFYMAYRIEDLENPLLSEFVLHIMRKTKNERTNNMPASDLSVLC